MANIRIPEGQYTETVYGMVSVYVKLDDYIYI